VLIRANLCPIKNTGVNTKNKKISVNPRKSAAKFGHGYTQASHTDKIKKKTRVNPRKSVSH